MSLLLLLYHILYRCYTVRSGGGITIMISIHQRSTCRWCGWWWCSCSSYKWMMHIRHYIRCNNKNQQRHQKMNKTMSFPLCVTRPKRHPLDFFQLLYSSSTKQKEQPAAFYKYTTTTNKCAWCCRSRLSFWVCPMYEVDTTIDVKRYSNCTNWF